MGTNAYRLCSVLLAQKNTPHSQTHTYSHTHSPSHTHALTYTHTHIHTLTHTHAHARMHARTHLHFFPLPQINQARWTARPAW